MWNKVADKANQEKQMNKKNGEARMALFNEKEVVSENQHEQLDIKEMTIGESFGFYFTSQRTATSEEYGDFTICQGLKVDLDASDVDALVSESTAASFIPNTLLCNKIAEGALLEGELYRIEKAWNKGQTFADGKRSKGWGYKLFSLSIEPIVKKQLTDAYKSKVNGINAEETESEAPKKPGV